MKEAISTDIKTIIIREFYGQLYAKILEHLNEMDKPRKLSPVTVIASVKQSSLF